MIGSVLVVDDEALFAKSIARILQKEGLQTAVAGTAAEARLRIAELQPDVVLMDLQLPDGHGGQLMAELIQKYQETSFIIVTAHGSIRSAVDSTRSGAADYLTKPMQPEDVVLAVRRVLDSRAMKDEVKRLRSEVVRPQDGVGESVSSVMRAVLEHAGKAAAQEGMVLLLGESGTGKDHLARWIHNQSPRKSGPFFCINCAALPRELAESELFGHEPGAFTGTRGRRRGLLELAEKGTLLLDEIGELDLALQSKLLTFLDSRTFMRLGGERQIRCDARIFAATNRNLLEEVAQGRFRKDLYYRLAVFPIQLPALRERREDIPFLVTEILDRLKTELRLPARPAFGRDVMTALQSYSWPGNVRELRNVLERALILSTDGAIHSCDLAVAQNPNDWCHIVRFPKGESLHDITREVARKLVLKALEQGGTKQEAARLLGISRHALAYQMRTLEIADEPGEEDSDSSRRPAVERV